MKLPEDQLRAAMSTLNWTNEMLAEKCGVRVETVHHWLKGKKRIPSKLATLIVSCLIAKERENALATSAGK